MYVEGDDFSDYPFPIVKIIGIGEIGEKTLKKFSNSDFYNEYKHTQMNLQLYSLTYKTSDQEIEDLIYDSDWIFVIADYKNSELARKIEQSYKCYLKTNLFLFPTVEDIKIDEIKKDFGTVIALPEDKISETRFTKHELITKIITMILYTASWKTLVGLDFIAVIEVMKNSGIMYVGIGEGLKGDLPINVVKKSLKSPLMLCDTNKSSKFLINFVGDTEEFSMKEISESINFIEKFYTQKIVDDFDYNKLDISYYWQVCVEKNSNGISVIIIASDS